MVVRLVRWWSVFVLATLVGGMLTAPANAAGPTATNVFVACGYGGAAPGGSGCTSLDQALAAATAHIGASDGATSIYLLPGTYCPIDIPLMYHDLTIVGTGPATLPGPPTTGMEAELSTFRYDAAHCTNAPAFIRDTHGFNARIVLQNVAFDGSVVSGPSRGVDVSTTFDYSGAGLTMRDTQVQSFSGLGVNYVGSGLSIAASAILGNHDGLFSSGEGDLLESTVAGNTANGVIVSGRLTMINDTVAHNTYGVAIPGFGNAVDPANNIVLDNSGADCTGTVHNGGDWEYSGTPGVGAGGYNLVGPSCRTDYVSTDLDYDVVASGHLAQPADNGGPTLSILPPNAAHHAGSLGWCGTASLVGGSDQREGLPAGTCDLGSVDTDASLSPDLNANALDFGDLTIGQPDGNAGDTLAQNGGGLVAVKSVVVSGAGFSLTYDGCTWAVLTRRPNRGSCSVGISAHPSDPGPMSGTVTFQTTGGTVTRALTANAVQPPDPSALTAPAGSPVSYGHPAVLGTTLTDTTTSAALGDRAVALLAKPAGSAAYTQVATATTDSTGHASASVTPTRSTTYEWSFAGGPGHQAATSDPSLVRVLPIVTAALDHRRVAHHHAVRAFGTVAPKLTGATVRLQRKGAHGWTVVATGTIARVRLPNGRRVTGFVLGWTPPRAGTETLRVQLPVSPGYGSAVSPTLRLTVT